MQLLLHDIDLDLDLNSEYLTRSLEISRLQQVYVGYARYARIIHYRPCCNLYINTSLKETRWFVSDLGLYDVVS